MFRVLTIVGNRSTPSLTSHALAVVNAALARSAVQITSFQGAELNLSFPGEAPTSDATMLVEAVAETDLVILATPEYHGSYSAFSKLVIENLGFPSILKGKPMALLGVAGGRIGAIKSLEQLRITCAHVGALVLPKAVSIATVSASFDKSGACINESTRAALESFSDSILTFLHDFIRPRQVLLELAASGVEVPWSIKK